MVLFSLAAEEAGEVAGAAAEGEATLRASHVRKESFQRAWQRHISIWYLAAAAALQLQQ